MPHCCCAIDLAGYMGQYIDASPAYLDGPFHLQVVYYTITDYVDWFHPLDSLNITSEFRKFSVSNAHNWDKFSFAALYQTLSRLSLTHSHVILTHFGFTYLTYFTCLVLTIIIRPIFRSIFHLPRSLPYMRPWPSQQSTFDLHPAPLCMWLMSICKIKIWHS